MSKPQIVLPADVHDALELSALAYGGIGGGLFAQNGTPVCIYGHSGSACALDLATAHNPIADILFKAGINTVNNDAAVQAVNARIGADKSNRIPFVQYCAELNIVRGDT